MLSSMTGFSRLEGAAGAWTWAVEARSVNGRNLEVRFRGPPGFDALERATREAAQARFQRGQLTVNVQARRADSEAGVRVNQAMLQRYLELSEALVAGGRAQRPSAAELLSLRGVVDVGEAEEDAEARAVVEAAMGESLAAALDALRSARREEGAALASVLSGLVARIAELSAEAEAEASAQVATIRDRFARRLAELTGEVAPADRVLQEAAMMAAKADVREELDRLTSHVAAARALLAEGTGVGRRLDFLTQEFMREANTLCAKSATTTLTATGLALKAVIDQFREQVQNVE
jgi:uncharacterized protein (TIGR00255 family)